MQPTESNTSVSEESANGKFGCLGANRFVILVLVILFLSFNLSAIISYNATYVSMVNLESSPYWADFITSNKTVDEIDWNSSDLPLSDRRFAFTTIQKMFGFAASFFGAIIAVIPMAAITKRFGCHKVMSCVGILGTILVTITPFIITWSYPVFVVLRVFQGLTLANLFTAAGIVINEWAAINEKGIFIAVLSAYVEFGAVFTMPVAGAVAQSAGWPCVFYLHGIILGVLTLVWIFYYRDRAVEHPFLQEKEWRKISFGKKPNQANAQSTPFRKIISSLVIWSIWIAVIGNFLVSQFSVSFAPLYLRGVVGCEPSEAGILTLIPMASLLIIKCGTGLLSDRLKSMSELSKMKMFNSCALLGSSIFFIVLSCSTPGQSKVLDVILLSIPMALLGFSSGGYGKCAVVVAGQYSPFVMSVIQIIACTSLMGGSFLVPALTPNDSFSEWQHVFIIYGAVLAFTNTIFVVFARAEPAKWAQQKGDLILIKAVMGDGSEPSDIDPITSRNGSTIDSNHEIPVNESNESNKDIESVPSTSSHPISHHLSASLHKILDETQIPCSSSSSSQPSQNP